MSGLSATLALKSPMSITLPNAEAAEAASARAAKRSAAVEFRKSAD